MRLIISLTAALFLAVLVGCSEGGKSGDVKLANPTDPKLKNMGPAKPGAGGGDGKPASSAQ